VSRAKQQRGEKRAATGEKKSRTGQTPFKAFLFLEFIAIPSSLLAVCPSTSIYLRAVIT
jgi:hypothetical protein